MAVKKLDRAASRVANVITITLAASGLVISTVGGVFHSIQKWSLIWRLLFWPSFGLLVLILIARLYLFFRHSWTQRGSEAESAGPSIFGPVFAALSSGASVNSMEGNVMLHGQNPHVLPQSVNPHSLGTKTADACERLATNLRTVHADFAGLLRNFDQISETTIRFRSDTEVWDAARAAAVANLKSRYRHEIAPRLIHGYEQARSWGLGDSQIDTLYQFIANTTGFNELCMRIGALAEALTDEAAELRHAQPSEETGGPTQP